MATQQRLLVIEDDYDVAELLLMYFKSQNYEVYHADHGQKGVELARTKFPQPHLTGHHAAGYGWL